MLRVLSEPRKKPGMGWTPTTWALVLGLAFVLWLITVVTYWIVGHA